MIAMLLFKRALAYTLKYEGGFSDHPNDPGGATMRGVAQAVYNAWRTGHGLPNRHVKLIEQAELEDIYLRRYWDLAGCNVLPWPLSLAVFDMAVNCGVGQAVRALQRATGMPEHAVDGAFGADTRRAVEKACVSWPPGEGAVRLAKGVIAQRRSYYDLIIARKPKLAVFREGWLKRAAQLEAVCEAPTAPEGTPGGGPAAGGPAAGLPSRQAATSIGS